MKICICISGQIRGSETTLLKLSKEIQKISSEHDVTVIFSVWDKKYHKLQGPLGFYNLLRIFERQFVKFLPQSYLGECFWDKFPKTYNKIINDAKTINIAEIEKMFPFAIIDVESEIMDLNFGSEVVDFNSKRMLYKRWRCNEIKKKIESKRNSYFDLVLVGRPDISITFGNKNINKVSDDCVYLPRPYFRKESTNDVFAVMSSRNSNIYTSLFSKSLMENNWNGIHKELYWLLVKNAIIEKDISEIDVEYHGLVQSDLLTFDYIKGDNAFMDTIGNALSLNARDAISICHAIKESDYTSSELIIINSLLSFLYLKTGELELHLEYFIRADISNVKISSFKESRHNFVKEEFKRIAKRLKYQTPIELIYFLTSNKINTIAKENLTILKNELA